MDVLNRQAGIGLVETDRRAVCPCRKVHELLKVLSAGRRRRVLREFEDEIEHLSDVLGEIGDVFLERTVIDSEETNLVVLERNELREVRRADLIQVVRGPAAPRAQDQLYRNEMEVRLDRQDHQKRMQFAGSTHVRRRRQGFDLL